MLIARPASDMERLLRPFAGEEIASEGLAEWQRVRPASSVLDEVPHPSRILSTRSEFGDRPGQLYTRMVDSDTELAGLLDKRKKAVLRLPRRIDPADSTPEAIETAEFVRSALSRIPQRHINLEAYLNMIPYGISVQEIIWEKVERGPLNGAWLPVDIVDRPMWRFAFDRRQHRLFVRRRNGVPIPAPDFKFLVARSGTKDSPWGKAQLDFIYWAWFLKKHAAKYYAIFVERFASPLVVGKYPHQHGDSDQAKTANEEQKKRLLDVIMEIQNGTGIAVPTGLDIVFMEASRGGDAGYQAFLSWLTRAEALIILGEVDTSGLAKGPGSFAKSQVSNEVRLENVSHDAHVISSFETETLIRWLVAVNFGPEAPVPRSVVDAMDAYDRQTRVNGIKQALADGVPVPLGYYRMTLQVPEPVEGEPVVEHRPAPAPGSEAPTGLVQLEAEEPDLPSSFAEALDGHLEEIVQYFSGVAASSFDESLRTVAGSWTEGDIAPLLAAVAEPATLRTRAETLETATVHGVGRAFLSIRDELGDVFLAEPGDFRRANTPGAAIEFWLLVLSVPKSAFLRLLDAIRKIVFTAARVAEGSLLLEVYRLAGRAVATGMDRATFVRELTELYQKKGLLPQSKWYTELLYANNVRQAAHLARYEQLVRNPTARRLIAYLFWWTIGDPRVRERRDHNHAIVSGFTAPPDHPFWGTWWPLAGHNCRCGVGSISHPEARRRGLTGLEPRGGWPIDPGTGSPAQPDPGFRGAPDLDRLQAEEEERLARLLEEVQAERSPVLEEAIRRLFEALQSPAER